MKDSTKVILGTLAGVAAGVAIGIAISDEETVKNLKDTLAEAGDQLNLKLQGLLEDSRDYLGDLKEKVADHQLGIAEHIENTEG